MTDSWKKSILEHLPHGEEGSLELKWDDVVTLQKILLDNGYAVCVTGGSMDDEYRINWIFAGNIDDDLDWADYDEIVFSGIDYFNDYVEAYNDEYNTAEENS